MFWKTSSERHCFCLKPTTHCTFAERIRCSIVCLNVYSVLKNFFWKLIFLLEAHHTVYFHIEHILFNCMFECLYCFEKLILKPIATTWSPPLTVISQSAYFVQSYIWMCIMFQKNSSESYCFCLKPTTQCTFKERILCSIVRLNMYNVSMTSSESHCLCLKPTTHCTSTDRILCSIVCLNAYNVLKNFFWKALLLLEAHHPLYFHRAHTLFNCMFEYV